MLPPPSPENSVEGPGTAGEDTPLATGSRVEHRTARKVSPPTANSEAGLGTEGACPPLTPGAKPGRGDTLRLASLLPAATTEEPEPVGRPGLSYTQHQPEGADAHSLHRLQTLKTQNWRQGTTRPLTTRGLRSQLLPVRMLLSGTTKRLGLLLLLSRTLLTILHKPLELEKGEVGTLTTPVFS
ncbi:hypothetical protein E2C01_033930 [Portunus trituberculatus]|uniref:Uncharacterized protein n=1 Tax=Portunus trituberculatus TaxID=210409 RepID=A0A5B7F745_PORTR|nr:hypothetical protein [Portunus trituberculatus]